MVSRRSYLKFVVWGMSSKLWQWYRIFVDLSILQIQMTSLIWSRFILNEVLNFNTQTKSRKANSGQVGNRTYRRTMQWKYRAMCKEIRPRHSAQTLAVRKIALRIDLNGRDISITAESYCCSKQFWLCKHDRLFCTHIAIDWTQYHRPWSTGPQTGCVRHLSFDDALGIASLD